MMESKLEKEFKPVMENTQVICKLEMGNRLQMGSRQMMQCMWDICKRDMGIGKEMYMGNGM